jgi:hypothetical protein
MSWKHMIAALDSQELNYQMALDIVESDEGKARREGVPTVSETMRVPAARRVSAHDPDWFAKLEKWSTR